MLYELGLGVSGWVGSRPANASTAGAPPASSEAILPCASTSTAIGVPAAPNLYPTLMPPFSTTTGERRPIALLSSTLSVETTSSFGAPLDRFASHAFRSGNMRAQKPQLGRQKRTHVGLPRKSESLTVLPARSGSPKS